MLLDSYIILPEDNYKIFDASKICEQHHLDPMSFTDSNEIFAKYTIKETAVRRRIDPDNFPDFSHKVAYDNGITVYSVEDTRDGSKRLKSILAFRNKKLLAFCAPDSNIKTWWNREDKSSSTTLMKPFKTQMENLHTVSIKTLAKLLRLQNGYMIILYIHVIKTGNNSLNVFLTRFCASGTRTDNWKPNICLILIYVIGTIPDR